MKVEAWRNPPYPPLPFVPLGAVPSARADTYTLVLQTTNGYRVPRIIGASGSIDSAKGFSGFDYFEWFGITHHRYWFKPSFSPLNPTGGVTDVATTPSQRSDYGFAHASEAEFGRILDFYQVAWEYEPTVFAILWDLDGKLRARLLPARPRALHRTDDASAAAGSKEEPQGPPAARAVPGAANQALLRA